MTTSMKTAPPIGAAVASRPPQVSADRPRAAFTDADTARITVAIDAARTESTREVYASAWRRRQRWCEVRGVAALPGDPWALCAYLSERAASGRAMGTLDLSCVAIRHVHRACGADDPVADETARQVRLGLRRLYGGAPRRLARALTVADVREIASAMRRSEPVALQVADVEHGPAGLL